GHRDSGDGWQNVSHQLPSQFAGSWRRVSGSRAARAVGRLSRRERARHSVRLILWDGAALPAGALQRGAPGCFGVMTSVTVPGYSYAVRPATAKLSRSPTGVAVTVATASSNAWRRHWTVHSRCAGSSTAIPGLESI